MKLLSPRHRNLFAAALLLVPAAIPKTAKPAPEAKFDIRVLITTEPEKVLHPKKGSTAQPATTVPRGHLVFGFVFFKDCQADAKKNCNLDVDLQGLTTTAAEFKNEKG